MNIQREASLEFVSESHSMLSEENISVFLTRNECERYIGVLSSKRSLICTDHPYVSSVP